VRMKKAVISLFVLFSLYFAVSVSAWDDSVTHPHITRIAAGQSIIDKFAKQKDEGTFYIPYVNKKN
jgi:hypothetical protein